jgi:hypothetical protein
MRANRPLPLALNESSEQRDDPAEPLGWSPEPLQMPTNLRLTQLPVRDACPELILDLPEIWAG